MREKLRNHLITATEEKKILHEVETLEASLPYAQ